MLKGLDVSSHNGYPLEGMARRQYEAGDFVIVKATQGDYYVNPTCDKMVQQAKSDNKLWGFYHYAGGKSPIAEAEYFVNHCSNYFGEGIPVIDWKEVENKNFGNTTWVKQFIDHVHTLTGVWCVIYVSQAHINQVANCSNSCGLWLAQWGVSSPGSVAPWATWTLWQWTSNNGTLGENYFNGNAEAWHKIAAGNSKQTQQTITPPPQAPTIEAHNNLEKAIEIIAKECIAGTFGNEPDRKQNIFNAVQDKVNALLGVNND